MPRMDYGSGDCNTVAASWINLDRMDACKDTNKTIDTSTFALHFSTSLDIAASESRHPKDVSWVWGLQPSMAAG